MYWLTIEGGPKDHTQPTVAAYQPSPKKDCHNLLGAIRERQREHVEVYGFYAWFLFSTDIACESFGKLLLGGPVVVSGCLLVCSLVDLNSASVTPERLLVSRPKVSLSGFVGANQTLTGIGVLICSFG